VSSREPSGLGQRLPLLRRIVYGAAVVYAVGSLVALAAWVTVGDTWWTQPANLTTFWWSLPAVVVAPAAWLARRRVLAGLLLVPALVWVWSYGSAFVPLPRDEPPPASLRVATFNTYVGAPDLEHVLDLVDDHEPDVLLLQEVFPDRQEQMEEALAERYPTQVVVQSAGVGGVGVLSRYPVVDVRKVTDASANSRETQVVVLDVEGTAVQVVPVHLISPCPACGRSLVERIELEGDVRRAEMTAVIAALDEDLPAIVGGDFNSTDRAEPYRRLAAAGFRDPQRERGEGMGFTWPNDGTIGPVLRIDWLLTRGFEPVRAVVGEGGPSDHRPVVVDLALEGS
jgi:endonuclease/exonuclease/phosphatase (EEP) superfamily protein YafD